MKKISILVALAILAVLTVKAHAFWAVVNGEEQWFQFYNYFSVDTSYENVILFDFWQNDTLPSLGLDKTFANGYMGTIAVKYDASNDTFFVDEIVDIPMNLCLIDNNCYSQDEIGAEYDIFANVIVTLANNRDDWKNTGLDGEIWQGFFDYNYQDNTPDMLSQNRSTIENWMLSQEQFNNTVFLPLIVK